MKVDPHAEIEILLGFAADHRGEVKDRTGAGIDQRLRGTRLGEVPQPQLDARVIGQRRDSGADVADDDALDLVLGAIGTGDCATFEQRRYETATEKPGAAGDKNLHFRFSRV